MVNHQVDERRKEGMMRNKRVGGRSQDGREAERREKDKLDKRDVVGMRPCEGGRIA